MGKKGQRGANEHTHNEDIAAEAERMEQDLSGIRQALRKPLDAEVSKGEVTVPQKAVMRVIVRNKGISLKDLSRELSLAHSTVSGIVDRLEKRGMLARKPDPEDGRFARIYPTAEVEAFIRDRLPVLTRGPLVAALERANEADRISIARALRRLRELLESA